MSSTARVDYSIRQNKTIERGIVFDGLRTIYDSVPAVPTPVYVGFGSVWFTDFHLAHRHLGINDMISMELDQVTATRAEFNKPYRSIEVLEGDSMDLLPDLLDRADLVDRPWITWLDFDQVLNADRLQQLDDLVRYLPANSTLVTTFSASPGRYGNPTQRPRFLEDLFGFAAGIMTAAGVREEMDLARTLAQVLQERLVSLALSAGRDAAEPVFRLQYKDGTPMVTVGIFLGDASTAQPIRDRVRRADWPGMVLEPITTTPLTTREVGAIRRLLPVEGAISRDDIRSLGFDLEDDQLQAFITHYNRYPTFAQLAF